MSAFVVFNPAADGGRVGRDWPALTAALETVFPGLISMPSRARGQIAWLVRDALREGHRDIVAVGGDGTINEAVNGFFEHGTPVSPEAVLSIVPVGGGDIGRGRATGMTAALRLRQARPHAVDLGHLSCVAPEGAAVGRFFLNAASFGLTAEMARRRNRARIAPLLGRDFARSLHDGLALALWRRCRVRLITGRGHDEIAGIAAVAVMNGTSFGGGLMAAPDADGADGMFDIAVLAGAPRRRLGAMLEVLRRAEAAAELRLLRSTRLSAAPTVETERPVPVEVDGEAVGQLPASFEIVPRALKLRR